MDAPTVLTAAELAAQLGVSRTTLARWRADGTGPPHVRVGHRLVRYRPDAVDAWLKAQEHP